MIAKRITTMLPSMTDEEALVGNGVGVCYPTEHRELM